MFNLPQSTFGRRSFLRFSALSVAAGSFLMNPISKAVAQAVKLKKLNLSTGMPA